MAAVLPCRLDQWTRESKRSPAYYRGKPRNDAEEACPVVPTLSCSTLDQTVFPPADARFLQHIRNNFRYARANEPAPRPAPPPPPPRTGSCAGCAVSNRSGAPSLGALLALVLVGGRRFARVRV